MRPRFVIFLLVSVVLILAIVFWLRPVRPPTSVEQPQATVQSNVPAAVENVASQRTPTQSTTTTTQPTIQTNPAPSSVSNMSILAVTRKFVESKNQPIDFYGLVIDQDSNALSGVHIKSSIEQLTVADPTVFEMGLGSKKIPIERTTGADGRFEIHDVSGDSFGVLLFKDGYEAESEKNGFGGGTSGSYENPVIFKMWSTNIHEQLITGGKSFHIEPDGRPYVIDLAKGTIAESGDGDLKVWVKRPEQITYGKRYDWSCEMDVLNGGLLAAADSSMYLAPADGYTPSFQFEQKVGSGWGDSTGEKRFYVRLNNGQVYGRITVELFAYYNDQIPGMVRLSYAINLSGSKILR